MDRISSDNSSAIDTDTALRAALERTIGDLREMSDRYREADAARARLTAIVDASDDAIIGEDLAGLVTSWNRAAEKLFGWSATEMIGRPVALLAPPDRSDEVPRLLARVREGQSVSRFETVRLTKAGRRIDVALSLSPIHDHAGVLVGAALIADDIASRKRTDAELLAAKEAAEEANRAKSRFLANVSHELRTPLNAIIGYSEMLSEDAAHQKHEQYLPDLHKIRDAGRHLLELIGDVLDLSKIEAGRMGLHLETFVVADMLRGIADTLAPLAARNRNTIEVRCPDTIGSLHADLTKVRQCLFNLLSNAYKFTEDGIIRVAVSRETKAGRDWVLFRVTDSGIGISPDQIERLFEAFAQAEESIARRFGGTGLGLTISRQLARMMGGDVTVDSAMGEGSTFTLVLPAEGCSSESRESTPICGNESVPLGVYRDEDAQHGRVVVIDDDPAARDLIARLVRHEGFEPALAESGEEGLRITREAHPAAIVLDVMMPGMDGWSVLSALKLDPATAGIPVIVTTVLEDQDIAWALGAADYLMKPVDRERLAAILRKYKPATAKPRLPYAVEKEEEDHATPAPPDPAG
jgi:PAS domain S-box-containing protein